jgi:hypothetical protein
MVSQPPLSRLGSPARQVGLSLLYPLAVGGAPLHGRRPFREFGIKSDPRRYLAVILSKLQEVITFFLVAGLLGAIREILSHLEMRC